MQIFDLKQNKEYLREDLELCSNEWGKQCTNKELKIKVDKKLEEILSNRNNKITLVLGLINDNNLLGFI